MQPPARSRPDGPSVDRIDYEAPQQYAVVDSATLGSVDLEPLIEEFRASDPLDRLKRISAWMAQKLPWDKTSPGYERWTLGETISRKRYLSCADHALVFGTLARAVGVPAVWVKSMNTDWIREVCRTQSFDGGRGHVFVEVFVDGWKLVDSEGRYLYNRYDPSQRLLPPNPGDVPHRFAYDKSGDPARTLFSFQKQWKAEMILHFLHFDVALLDTALPAYDEPVTDLRPQG